MLRFIAILFGIAFMGLGIMGFMPDFAPNGLLFKYLLVNPLHNFIHFATGLAALFCGLSNSLASKVFFIAFGIIYLIIAIYGFYAGPGMIFDLIAINHADNIFHLIVSLIALAFGFFFKARRI